jgi:hypothetical protein
MTESERATIVRLPLPTASSSTPIPMEALEVEDVPARAEPVAVDGKWV